MCFELDVIFTIDKDLENESMIEKQNETQQMSIYEQQRRDNKISEDLGTV